MAQHLVQDEVVQLVGANQVLRLLGDGAVLLRGQELRGDGRVQHVVEHGRLGIVSAGIGHVAHQVAHQGLGDGGVDAVHAHVVAVVGGPAKCQLGEVSRADDHATLLVGDVHENLRALAGLAVLVRDVTHGLVVADVRKVLAHGGGYAYLAQLAAQGVTEGGGVGVRAVRGAKAGHGDGDDAVVVQSQQVEGAHGNEQGQRGVQTAGNADDRMRGMRVRKALGQAVGLDGEDVLAAGSTLGPVGGNEGVRVNVAGEQSLLHLKVELAHHVARGLRRGGRLEAGEALALAAQHLHVHLAGAGARPEGRRLRQRAAVLADEVVAGEDHVLSGLSPTRAGVHVAADQPRGLTGDERAPVGRLAHDGIGGGEVGDQRGARQRVRDAGRLRRPQVLADLRRHDQLRHGRAAEELTDAKGHVALPRHADARDLEGTGSEVAALVELVVGGDKPLGHDTQDAAGGEKRRAVVELAAHAQGHAHQDQGIQVCGLGRKGGKALLRTGQQLVLQEEVLAGVARDHELRQHDDLGPRVVGLLYAVDAGLNVVVHVRHADARGARRNRDKTVPHENLPRYTRRPCERSD